MNKVPEIGVIGAGPGGLASAMLLARAGARVTVFESLDHVGGRSSTISLKSAQGPFRFDCGPTFFLYPRILQDIFAACGRTLENEIELLRVDPQYRLVFAAGKQLDVCADPIQLAQEIARICPEDAAALPRFLAENRRKLEAFRPVLENPCNSVLSYVSPKMLRALPQLHPFRTLDADLQRFFRNPLVRLAFSFQSKYLGMSPFRCPSLFSILGFMEHEYGVWHPRGGCGAVMSRMADVAQDLGARIRLSESVQEILFDGKKAVGLRTASGTHKIDALVINADFAQTMTTLVPNKLRSRWSDRYIGRKKFSCSTFMLYLGIEGDIPELKHHTIYLAEDYRKNVAEIEAGLETPTEASLYVQNAGVTDDSLAPPGHTTLYVLVPVGNLHPAGVDWDSQKARFRTQTLDRLRALGVPDLERRIKVEKMLTPIGWKDELNVFRGATFNLSHNLSQMLYMRPHNRFEDLAGVYLVGGGTHPGSGLPVIFESARISSRLIAEDFNLEHVPETRMALQDEPEPVVAAVP